MLVFLLDLASIELLPQWCLKSCFKMSGVFLGRQKPQGATQEGWHDCFPSVGSATVMVLLPLKNHPVFKNYVFVLWTDCLIPVGN